ncbi:unnamed protein product [Hanseniaspora opuntiae]
MLKIGAGIYKDWRDRLTPQSYKADWTDALSYRVIPSTIEIFLNNLLPAIAFSQDLSNRTSYQYGINEILMSQGISGLLFGLAGYPLSIVGVSAPSCILCYTIYDIFVDKHTNTPKAKYNDGFEFFPFMFWVYFWTALCTCLSSVFNLLSFFQYVTVFPCDIFGLFINVVYVVKGCQLLGESFHKNDSINDVADGFGNITIALCMTFFGLLAKNITSTRLFNHKIRIVIKDYCIFLSVIFWSGVIHFGNAFKFVHFERLNISKSFKPTSDDRKSSWLAVKHDISAKYVFLALPFGIIVWILLFFDHNISSLMAQKREYKLKKKSMYNWDFCLLSVHTFLCGLLGLPAGHCLIPQSFIHTETLIVYKDAKKEKKTDVPDDSENIYISGVVEQRFTNFMQGLLMIICMCRPFLVCLNQIPQCVLSGLFFILGIGGIQGNAIIGRMTFLVSDYKTGPLKDVKMKKLFAFTMISVAFAVVEVLISQLNYISIAFPLILIISIIVTFFFKYGFTKEELEILDTKVVSRESIKNLLPENLHSY